MSNLKSLTFTVLPNKSVDPAVRRRKKLIEKLYEQLKLVRNPNFKITFNRYVGQPMMRKDSNVSSSRKRNPSNPGGSLRVLSGETCS